MVLTNSGNQRRAFEELLARELPTDGSGAFSLGDIFNIGSSLVSALGNLLGGNNKRELGDDLVARELCGILVRRDDPAAVTSTSPATNQPTAVPPALTTNSSGALDIGDILRGFGSILPFFFKREEIALLGRE